MIGSLSEITEEPFGDDHESGSNLPPVGNGTYLVKMRLKKDMPNYLPMYGRKVSLNYRGIKKQCNSCFGPHLRKFCKNERMSLEEYVEKFRIRNTYVPEQFYGKLAKLENIVDQEIRKVSVAAKNSGLILESESLRGAETETSSSTQAPVRPPKQPMSGQPPPSKLTVTLR